MSLVKCRFIMFVVGCSIVYAVEAASLHPAKCLNIVDHKGRLNFNCDADFVMLSEDLHVKSTWIAGECVYRAKSQQ